MLLAPAQLIPLRVLQHARPLPRIPSERRRPLLQLPLVFPLRSALVLEELVVGLFYETLDLGYFVRVSDCGTHEIIGDVVGDVSYDAAVFGFHGVCVWVFMG